MATRNI